MKTACLIEFLKRKYSVHEEQVNKRYLIGWFIPLVFNRYAAARLCTEKESHMRHVEILSQVILFVFKI